MEKLRHLEGEADGDLARVIEILLLENHVLMQHQSVGFRRRVDYEFSGFPRFLHLEEEHARDTAITSPRIEAEMPSDSMEDK